MSDLRFGVIEARPARDMAAPALLFRLRIENAGAGQIHAIALRCQVHIEARNRSYKADDAARLHEVFGSPSQWDTTLRALVWAHVDVIVPSFGQIAQVDLPVPCSHHVEIGADRFLHGVRDGDVPLRFLFSGSVFRVVNDRLSVEPIAWEAEARWLMPAGTWRETFDHWFPKSACIALRTDTIDALSAFRTSRSLPGWDETMEALLGRVETRSA